MTHITVLGLDLAKTNFQLCGLNQANKIQFNKTVKRDQLVDAIRQHPDALIAMEACGSAHYWARVLSEQGHRVRLIPAQHVKSFCRGNKNDTNDALAIAESARRPNLHQVQVKTIEQQDHQTLLRIRSRYQHSRTATINQTRGLIAEYGVVLPKTVSAFHRGLPAVLEDGDNALTPIARRALAQLYQDYLSCTNRIARMDAQLADIARQHPTVHALTKIRGIGPITAVALYACIGSGHQFRNARQLAAWIGLVPKHRGSGGKVQLGSISKRGNAYIRLLLIHGARTVMNWMKNKDDTLSRWARQLSQRRGKHKTIVAVANKTARMVWVVLNKGIEALPRHYLSTH